jgi:hypothetical protein
VLARPAVVVNMDAVLVPQPVTGRTMIGQDGRR